MTPCDLSKLHSEQRRVPPEARGIPYDRWLFRQPLCTRAELLAWLRARVPLHVITPPKPSDPQGGLF